MGIGRTGGNAHGVGMGWNGWTASGMRRECVGNASGMRREFVGNASGMRRECVGNWSGMRRECIGNTGSRGFMGSRRLSDPLRAIRDHAGPGLNSTRDGSAWNLRATMRHALILYSLCVLVVVKRSILLSTHPAWQ